MFLNSVSLQISESAIKQVWPEVSLFTLPKALYNLQNPQKLQAEGIQIQRIIIKNLSLPQAVSSALLRVQIFNNHGFIQYSSQQDIGQLKVLNGASVCIPLKRSLQLSDNFLIRVLYKQHQEFKNLMKCYLNCNFLGENPCILGSNQIQSIKKLQPGKQLQMQLHFSRISKCRNKLPELLAQWKSVLILQQVGAEAVLQQEEQYFRRLEQQLQQE